MRNRRRLLSSDDSTREIWPSFTDVMSTMALILFVLVLLAYVRSLIAARQLQAFQRQIVASEQQLRDVRAQLATGRAELDASKAELRAQQGVIAESNRQLDTVKSQLQSIAVLRVSVLNKVKQAIEAEVGSSGDGGAALVTVGDSGNIVINESLVFEYGSYAIKPEARPLLDTLARAFGRILDDADVRANIDTILIQGHTDERGSASFNWDLSAKRATAVLNYLFEANKTLADSYGSYFAASAYSKFRPLDAARTEEAYQRNRRIEISVIPRDDNVRKVIDDYVQNVAATPLPSSPPAR
ncbi:MAG TPA: OmpA family protein [Polyangiaceae bacterium]|nr:OmpA family protein [Polyangiaceae bacterium]